jgi:predicted RNA-binding Zn ribbon-like protein
MTSTVSIHTHEVSIDDALDFIDTLEFEHGEPVDHLEQPPDAIDWLRTHGLLHAGPLDPAVARLVNGGPEADRALDHVRKVRAALREIVDATYEDRAPSPDAVELTNRAMRAHQQLVLVAGPDGVSLDHRHEGDPLDDALARIAVRVAREVSGDHADRIRVCANDSCRWVFFDSSRTGRRRWCDMATCGNRAKAARHRARTKDADVAARA